ncbi:FAD-binding oxidoreductase [Phytoactinopolyspora endophytica]|uniref:FAD-binding oxidoreductase n=1 Tax=Phytoactinopolyspora endophytica TaxID=1642495 RepID=UPI00101BA6EF|nr:FAD-binding oxidoreductase [Phytoactinopolyspora endophytica]
MNLIQTRYISARLQAAFAGQVHVPGDDSYDRERLSWHRTLDPRPAAVVESDSADDVRAAVLTAREQDLPFAVQATGHGTYTPCDGGLLLKTGRMATVQVDPESRTARVGPGARWTEVVTAAAGYGLVPISGTLGVGATGFTLGGGAGYLSRTYGFAADSLVSADLVTADGRKLTASGDEHPDLFWAIRGGGGNFGVATSLELLLFPVRRVYAGMSYYPAERATEILSVYREWALDEPDELNTGITVMQMPDMEQVPEPLRGRAVLGVRAICLADADNARNHLDRLTKAAGTPLMGGFAESTFADASAAVGGTEQPPTAVDQRFELFHDICDDVVAALVDTIDTPVAAVEVRHWGGAMGRPGAHGGPVGHRDVPFSVLTAAMLSGDEGTDAGAIRALDTVAGRIRPHATGGSFLNFLGDTSRTEAAYTADNYRRLRKVKRDWDPENVLSGSHNIPPAAADTMPAAADTMPADAEASR